MNTLSLTEGIIIYSVLVLMLSLLDQYPVSKELMLLSTWPPFDNLATQLRKSALLERLADLFDVVAMLRSLPGSKAKASVQRCNLSWKMVTSLSRLLLIFAYLVCFHMYFCPVFGLGRPPVERSSAVSTKIIQWKDSSFGHVVAVTLLLPSIFSYLVFKITKLHHQTPTDIIAARTLRYGPMETDRYNALASHCRDISRR